MNAKTPPAPPASDPSLRSPKERKPQGFHLRSDIDDLLPDRDDIFFAAVETTRMPMTVTDPRRPDNPIVFANHAFLAMTGYSAEEIIGSNCRFLQGPETDPAALADLRLAIDERREHATEILNYRKDGYSFWNALFVSPVFNQTGELVYFFGSQLDVTRRREAEDAVRQAQKMEALGRLTGGIAHDFNNLLQVIVGHLDLMSNHLQKPEIDRARLKRGADSARSAAERASSLTQQLLAFARKQRLEGRTLNLNRLVDSLRDLADRTLGDDVVIKTTLAEPLWNCRIDPAQVEMAFLNILINARDAMAGRPDKRLSIATTNLTIIPGESGDHHNLGPGRYVSISIRDTGTGIPSHVVERVMDPFFSTKEEGKGTGLGLSMVYGFARQSGGAAQLESSEGVGTTVRMLFPAVDEPVTDVRRSRGRAIDRPGDETILLVEDRRDVADLARTILQDFGYTVYYAQTAHAALDVLATHGGIDLLFTDLIMPGGMNGVALAREAKIRHPHLKILLTTGYAEASLERTEAGGSEFDVLNKPYGRADLARKVRVILDGPTGVT